jgi:hypothetical protein
MLTFADRGVLEGPTRDGTVETLGPAGGPAVTSPDGRQWMWSALLGSHERTRQPVYAEFGLGADGG